MQLFKYKKHRVKTKRLKYGNLLCTLQVTDKEINKIDRKKSRLTSKLSQFINDTVLYAVEGTTLKVVKEEPTPTDDVELPIDSFLQFKEEDDFTEFTEFTVPDMGHSSDDEPLSVHKVVSIQVF